MQIYHHYHQNAHHYFKSDLSLYELSIWLQNVGSSLIAIFIPIILLTSGFSLIDVILFYLLYNILDFPLNFVARKVILRLGARFTIFLGLLSQVIYLILLYFLRLNWFFLIFLALSRAIYDTFYWVSHWFIFNECVVSKKGTGKQVGVVKIIRRLGSLLAPGIGAFFLVFVNKEYLIILSILFLFVSLIPLFKIKLSYNKPKKVMNLKNFFKNRENKFNLLSTCLQALHHVNEDVILPIFVFITFASIEAVGLLPIISALFAILFMFYIGKLSDKYNKRVLIIGGALVIGTIWILRLFFPTLNIIYLTTIFVGFLGVLFNIPIDALLIENGKKTDMLDTSTLRNAAHMGIRAILYAVLYLVLNVFNVSFSIAALAMFGLVIINLVFVLEKRVGILN